MDVLAVFQKEVFRPLVTLVVPGSTALAPYVLVLRAGHPEVRQFWNDHTTAAFLIIALAAIAVGLVLEGLGARVEICWDKKLETKSQDHLATWYRYLRLALDKEPIGQRYLRTITLAMKFELAMACALPVMYVGVLWLDTAVDILSWTGGWILAGIVLIVSAHLLHESWASAGVLGRVRSELVQEFGRPSGDAKESANTPR